ncbi:MAG: STAS domain-containing protein [Mycobacterium sp.]|uniref:STAS domain-containing protein n=1 Tax=Mycobacterium sp. TaxID=1785 RepID=UPI003C3FEB42
MTVTQSWQRSGSAELSVRPGPSATVITAHGELDAANANQITVFVERALRDSNRVIVDLRGLNFFGTAGFSALHRINVVCSAAGVPWVLVAGRATDRVLRICDPDDTLPTTDSLPEFVSEEPIFGEPRPLLQLVPQPR